MEAISRVLSGLIRKRAEMAGEAEALRAGLTTVGANTVRLDVVIGPFDPSFNKPPRRVAETVSVTGQRWTAGDGPRACRAGRPQTARS